MILYAICWVEGVLWRDETNARLRRVQRQPAASSSKRIIVEPTIDFGFCVDYAQHLYEGARQHRDRESPSVMTEQRGL